MAWYEYPTNFSGTSVGGVSDFFVKYPSTIVGNSFAAGIVLMVWIMAFALSMSVGIRKALAVSSFVTLILAVYLMSYLNPVILIVLVFMVIIGMIGGKSDNSF